MIIFIHDTTQWEETLMYVAELYEVDPLELLENTKKLCGGLN